MLNFCTCPACTKAAKNVPGLTKREEQLAVAVTDVFREQLAYAKREEVWRTRDFGWLSNKFWHDEMYKKTRGIIRIEAELAAKHQSRVLGVQVTDFIDRPRVLHALDQEGYKFARAVNKTTADRLREQLKEAEQAGESIPQITERVQEVFVGTERELPWRAEMIARTETAQAYTVGTRELWKETGVVENAVWVSSSDACEFCLALDGQTVELDKPFFEVGDSMTVGKSTMSLDYRQVDGPPLHPYCRCALKAELVPIRRTA